VLPHDHAGIGDDDILIRRISEHLVVLDGNGLRRISSIAFRASSGSAQGMSIDIEKLIVEGGEDPRRYVTSPVWVGSVALRTGDVRSHSLSVGYDPVDGNACHGQVWGAFTRSVQKALQGAAQWYVPIEGVSISA
jgi:hypothetical protein